VSASNGQLTTEAKQAGLAGRAFTPRCPNSPHPAAGPRS